jgi:hypothetical protein
MDDSSLSPVDVDALAAVRGGAGGATNQDVTTRGVRLVPTPLGRLPARVNTTNKVRTQFGACADDRFARCAADGGSAQTVGRCELRSIEDCWKAHQR